MYEYAVLKESKFKEGSFYITGAGPEVEWFDERDARMNGIVAVLEGNVEDMWVGTIPTTMAVVVKPFDGIMEKGDVVLLFKYKGLDKYANFSREEIESLTPEKLYERVKKVEKKRRILRKRDEINSRLCALKRP